MPVWPSPLLADSSGSNRIPGGDLHVPLWAWVATIGAIVVMVAVDLLVLRRQERELTMRSAAVGTAVWVAVGLAFAGSSGPRSAARPPASTSPVM